MCTDGNRLANCRCDCGLEILTILLGLGDAVVQAQGEAVQSWIDIPFISKYLTYFWNAASSRLESQNCRLIAKLLYPKAE